MSRYQHEYFWPSLATPPYRPLLLEGLPGYIQYLHRAAVSIFELDVLHLFDSVKRSTSSSLLLQQCPACLVRLILIVFMMGGRWPDSCCFVGCCLRDLFNIARSIQVFSPYILLAYTWCIHIAVSILLLLGRNCTSFYESGLTSIRLIANQ